MIELGGRPLTIGDVARVAREGEPVSLARGARERMKASRAVVERALRENLVVYGVTTGFGELKDRRIAPDQVRELQLNLLRSHCAGVGRFAPPEVARAMILLRAASLAQGHSGCRPELVEARGERLRDRGLDPFRDDAVPEAVLRFRQGVGRLIRRADDRGVLVICDPRLAQASYRRPFLEALPVAPRLVRDVEELAVEAAAFFEAEHGTAGEADREAAPGLQPVEGDS